MGLKTVRLGLLVYMKLNWTKCMQYWLDLFTLCNESRTRVENRMNNIYISDCTYICYNPTHCCSAWAWPPPHQSTLPCLTPLSTPIYWGSKAWLNFLATPQSTLVFFGTKAKPFSTITFYLSHPFFLSCHTPLHSTPFSTNTCTFTKNNWEMTLQSECYFANDLKTEVGMGHRNRK
jgi:hypothetical protein